MYRQASPPPLACRVRSLRRLVAECLSHDRWEFICHSGNIGSIGGALIDPSAIRAIRPRSRRWLGTTPIGGLPVCRVRAEPASPLAQVSASTVYSASWSITGTSYCLRSGITSDVDVENCLLLRTMRSPITIRQSSRMKSRWRFCSFGSASAVPTPR